MIRLTTEAGELYFEQEAPIGMWRASARRLMEEVPPASGRVYVDGQLIGAAGDAANAEGEPG